MLDDVGAKLAEHISIMVNRAKQVRSCAQRSLRSAFRYFAPMNVVRVRERDKSRSYAKRTKSNPVQGTDILP
jgi:hypothetical protein